MKTSGNLSPVIERCFRVKELAVRWGLSIRTVHRILNKEPMVLMVPGRVKRPGKRTVTVPDSVVYRLEREMTKG
jgi:hypothetical protein